MASEDIPSNCTLITGTIAQEDSHPDLNRDDQEFEPVLRQPAAYHLTNR